MQYPNFKLIVSLFASAFLVACGGGGQSGGSSAGGSAAGVTTQSGQFINCPTKGLSYEIVNGEDVVTGVTDSSGTFTYSPGDTVRFYLGNIDIGSVTGSSIVMPSDVHTSQQAAVNLSRFLQTLDKDRNCDNGIQIDESVRTSAADSGTAVVSSADFDVDEQSFSSSDAANFAMTANGDTRALISAGRAQAELACTALDVGSDGDYDGVCTTWYIEDNNDPAIARSDQSQEVFDALTAAFSARPGDTIEFGPGVFEFPATLVLSHNEGITIKGQGMRSAGSTILDFKGSSGNGVLLERMTGVTVEDLTIIDSDGDALKIADSTYVTVRNVRAMWSSADIQPGDRGGMDPKKPDTLEVSCDHDWPSEWPRPDGVHATRGGVPNAAYPEATGYYIVDGQPRKFRVSSETGEYALYPVKSNHVLMDNVIAVGASDAGIYVGQSNDIIIKNSEAIFNVAGYEIENSDRADMFNNVAHCNTAGFLVFDLPGLNQYGDQTRVFDNYAGFNNQANFKAGGIVAAVPQGTGLLQLGYDSVEFFLNYVESNRTTGFVSASHQLLEDGKKDHDDKKMDLFPEGIYIHDNWFINNGNALQPPHTGPTDNPNAPREETLLPSVIGVKGSDPQREGGSPCPVASDCGNEGKGAHIVWDGYFDESAEDCDYPDGVDADSNGKPDYRKADSPLCRYNAYKFDIQGNIKMPKYWMCVENNHFSDDSRTYLNFNGFSSDPSNGHATRPAKTDISAHNCVSRFGEQLSPLPAAVVDEYVPGAAGAPPPTAAEVAELCENHTGAGINRAALAVNCPKLSQYNLFIDPSDPRTGFNDNGMLYQLNTALFSDYAKKYRVLFLPEGEKAPWFEGDNSHPNATLQFPVGTVIAKTFTFPHDDNGEAIVETRLLFHRKNRNDDGSHWEGLPYVWQEDGTDAELFVTGASKTVAWKYDDPDPDVTATYEGSTTKYVVPSANQCGTCHSNDDNEAGDAPIGPRVRNLNGPVSDGVRQVNQLALMIERGLLEAPQSKTPQLTNGIMTNALRIPRFNVPGDVGNIPILDKRGEIERFNAMSEAEQDLERRSRAWLEVNCAHCHNLKGGASSTGFLLDSFRIVDTDHGVCSTPTTSGGKGNGRSYLIVPGESGGDQGSEGSIMAYRIHTEESSDQMPPLARSVKHTEAVAIIDQWIDTVIDSSYADAKQNGCEDGGIPAP